MANNENKANNEETGGEGIPTASYGGAAVGPGEQIGPYKLLRILGEGGYGIVYLAERQRPVKRRVALKVIKPGMDTKQVIARFEAERQALALLDHPNIAHVFNAGTTDSGRPYFAMEYVKGDPITEHCDRYKLTIEERLKLFMTVCEAVQYAHQKAIIHRDIKPSNILVAYEGERAGPMIIDFGVAKALTQPLTERTLVTEQSQIIGTPEYMSPEQAEMTGQDIDTRTDIYSLGVLLYELLTGTLPFDPQTLREAGPERMRRIIREQDPQTPSARLSTIEPDESLSLAQQRRTDIRTWGHHLHGELDWITLKAMDKDRTRRYQTAYALAEDIQRYLNQEPVLAGPPSAVYKLRKFVTRNKALFVASAIIAAVVVFAALISTVLAITATQAKMAESALAKKQEKDLYFNQIKLADQQLNANRPVDALQLLNECPKHLRNWEWHYLYRRSHSREALPLGFEDKVISLDFSVDGSKQAAFLMNGKMVLQDVATDKDIFSLQVRNDPEQMKEDLKFWLSKWVAFCPDKEHVAAVGDDYVIKLISLVSERCVQSLEGHTDTVSQIEWSPDGFLLASVSQDNTVRIWDRRNGKQERIPIDSKLNNMAFSGDGHFLFVCRWDGCIERLKVQDILNGKKETGDTYALGMHPYGIAVSPDGRHIATGLWNGKILLHNDQYTEVTHTLEGHVNGVEYMAFTEDGTRLASASSDLTVRLWDVKTGQEILLIDKMHSDTYGLDSFITHVAFISDDHKLIVGSRTKTLSVFDASPLAEAQSRECRVLLGHRDPVTNVAYSPTGDRVIASGIDGTIRLWDTTGGEQMHTIDAGDMGTWSGQFDPNGNWITAWCCRQGRFFIKVWEATDPYKEQFSVEYSREPMAVAFSRDSKYLIVGGEEHSLDIYEWRLDKYVGKLGSQDDYIVSITASPDGRYLASAGFGGSVMIWDATRLHEPQKGRLVYEEGLTFMRVGFSPDSKQLAVGGREGDILILDVKSGDTLRTISNAHGGIVYCVVFSPNGKHLASCSSDKTVRIWDAETGDLIDVLLRHEGRVISVAFSPDSRHVVSSGIDAKVRIWTPKLD